MLDKEYSPKPFKKNTFLSKYLPQNIYEDLNKMILLIVLYAIQGIPLGLSFGSIPFILQQTVSKTDIGIFSLVGYPYCLKLLWSPIVDTFYFKRIGRRKSWIIPIQLLSGILLYYLGQTIDQSLEMRPVNVYEISLLFLLLILFTATQDIAVDGWAITILSKQNTSYSATCQNVGINIGFFGSFTILLALNSPEFCDHYLWFLNDILGGDGSIGILQIGDFIVFSAYLYFLFTFWLFLFVNEEESEEEEEVKVTTVYKQIWELSKRAHIRDLIIVLAISKFAFAAEGVSSIELLDRGFRKEDLALFALIDFPLQILYSVLAGRLSSGKNPLLVWLTAYQVRMGIAVFIQIIIYFYPKGELPFFYFILILFYYLLSSAGNSIMNVTQCGFFARISDQSIGGTYLTLLNTVSNLGGTWPKLPILYLIDYFTVSTCIDPDGVYHYDINCIDKGEVDLCKINYNGSCDTEREGFYIVNILCLVIGLALFSMLISKKLISIQNLQQTKWKVKDVDIQNLYVVSEY